MPTLANVSINDNSNWTTMLNMIYPVGSYYLSNTSISPSSKFGGSWSSVTGRFLYPNNNNTTGGGGTHTHNLSANGGACIDTLQGGTWLNIGKKTSSIPSREFTPNIKQANNTYESNSSTESGWHSVELMGKTDSGTAPLPAYRQVYCWYRTA